MKDIKLIAIDLAKNVFQICGLDKDYQGQPKPDTQLTEIVYKQNQLSLTKFSAQRTCKKNLIFREHLSTNYKSGQSPKKL